MRAWLGAVIASAGIGLSSQAAAQSPRPPPPPGQGFGELEQPQSLPPGYVPQGNAPPPPGFGPPPGYGQPGYPGPQGYPPGGPGYAPPGGPPPAGYGYIGGQPGPRTHRRVGLIVTGGVLDGLGIIALAIGIDLALVGSASTCLDLYGNCDSDDGLVTAGVVSMIGGGVLIAVGTPLLVMGIKKVPVEEGSLRPEVQLGLGRAGLRWSF